MITAEQAEAAIEAHGSIRGAARALGMPYSTLWEKRKRVRGPDVMVRRTQTIPVIADVHSPYQDEEAFGIALDYAASLDPRRVVINGDFADFYQVSSWKKDPDRMPFREEVERCRADLKRVRKAFPNAAIEYLEGNHEGRMQAMLWGKAPELSGLSGLKVEQVLGLEDLNIRYVVNSHLLNQKKPPFSLGSLFILHGHEVHVGAGGVNLARTYYLKCACNVLIGHHHQVQEYIHRRIDAEHEGAWLTGCLCVTSAEYLQHTNWCNGFTIVDLHDDGDFEVRNHKIINGKVL